MWWNGPDWLTKDFREWSKMQVPNRPTKILVKKTSKRKEDTNACATVMTHVKCGRKIRNGFPVGLVWFEYTPE